MYRNNSGYMLLNSLFSFSLFLILTLSLLPMITTVYKEQLILKERRYWLYALHDELQQPEILASLPTTFSLEHHEKIANLTIERQSLLIEGCISWENIRGKEEHECLYTSP